MRNLFDKVFTLDEFRFSAIVLVLFVVTGFAMYKYWVTGDITDNITELIKIIILTVGTVNGVKGVSELVGKINKVKSQTKIEDKENPKTFG